MSDSSSAEVFTLELPQGEVTARGLIDNPWDIAGKIYDLAKSKLNELVATNLPPRDEVVKAASEAYDKYVGMIEAAAKELFVDSVGRLYDTVSGVVKS